MKNREKRGKRRTILAKRGMGQVITVTIGLIGIVVVFSILNPFFLTSRNISNLLRQIAPTLITGIGQSYVLITGNIDLSIGSVVGMSCMVSATLMTKGVTRGQRCSLPMRRHCCWAYSTDSSSPKQNYLPSLQRWGP